MTDYKPKGIRNDGGHDMRYEVNKHYEVLEKVVESFYDED